MNTHEILVEARNLIDRVGWVQRDLGSPSYGFCALGAILYARNGNLIATGGGVWDEFQRVIGEDGLDFNNAPGRTKAEVLAAFDKVIAAMAPEPAVSFVNAESAPLCERVA